MPRFKVERQLIERARAEKKRIFIFPMTYWGPCRGAKKIFKWGGHD